jgi:hypothetical protein
MSTSNNLLNASTLIGAYNNYGSLWLTLLKNLNLPPLGDENQNGVSVFVTKTLLFVSARPLDAKWGDAVAVRKLLSVFDKQSGKLLRAIVDGRTAAAAPTTYLHGAKRCIAMAVGNGPTTRRTSRTWNLERHQTLSPSTETAARRSRTVSGARVVDFAEHDAAP